MSCVKYCVFTFPLVVTAVQTHGGVQSALRSIHAPTRNEEGTYIRASEASDVVTLRTPSIPSHQGMVVDKFLLGGWVARPSAFYFLRLRLHWSLCSLWSPLRLTVLNLTALCRPCSCTWYAYHFRLAWLLSYTKRKHALHIYALLINFVA